MVLAKLPRYGFLDGLWRVGKLVGDSEFPNFILDAPQAGIKHVDDPTAKDEQRQVKGEQVGQGLKRNCDL